MNRFLWFDKPGLNKSIILSLWGIFFFPTSLIHSKFDCLLKASQNDFILFLIRFDIRPREFYFFPVLHVHFPNVPAFDSFIRKHHFLSKEKQNGQIWCVLGKNRCECCPCHFSMDTCKNASVFGCFHHAINYYVSQNIIPKKKTHWMIAKIPPRRQRKYRIFLLFSKLHSINYICTYFIITSAICWVEALQSRFFGNAWNSNVE